MQLWLFELGSNSNGCSTFHISQCSLTIFKWPVTVHFSNVLLLLLHYNGCVSCYPLQISIQPWINSPTDYDCSLPAQAEPGYTTRFPQVQSRPLHCDPSQKIQQPEKGPDQLKTISWRRMLIWMMNWDLDLSFIGLRMIVFPMCKNYCGIMMILATCDQ